MSKKPRLVRVNARSQAWYRSDISTGECSKIDITTPHFGLTQMIKEPTQFESLSALCQLNLYYQTNLAIHSGVDPSLHPNYYYQIVLSKFNWKFYDPLSYERLVWHCKHADTDIIKIT